MKDLHELLFLKIIHTVPNDKQMKRSEHLFRGGSQINDYDMKYADSIAKDKDKTRCGKIQVQYICGTK